jgi:hypothetical protein
LKVVNELLPGKNLRASGDIYKTLSLLKTTTDFTGLKPKFPVPPVTGLKAPSFLGPNTI